MSTKERLSEEELAAIRKRTAQYSIIMQDQRALLAHVDWLEENLRLRSKEKTSEDD